ncbi:MAG: biopolymer transporter ExbD [Phycisphaerae bacterium]|nr:biopolymer transporter ExbD [Phycisphaerae bacterium]
MRASPHIQTVRRRARAAPPQVSLGANLTSLIDLSFLLVVFFVLVGRISSTERVALHPPTPRDPASELPGDESRVVLNVLASSASDEAYALGSDRFRGDTGGLTALRTRLVDVYLANPKARVNLRADRAARYDRVEPVMRLISAAAAEASVALAAPIEPRVNLVVLREAQGGTRGAKAKQ